MNEGIGGVPVSVGTGSAVVFRFIQVFFLNDLPAFDHTAAAVWTVVPAFLVGGSAAGTGLIILDLGAGDLFLVGNAVGGRTAESCAAGDPAEEPDDHHEGHYEENE